MTNLPQVPSWDDFFMTMVYLSATKSKDQSTHIGAVIIGPDKEVRSTGYNSFPRGINDDVPERQLRPEKYDWVVHAEENSILNAALVGVSPKGCVMYTNGIPCMRCAVSIVQSGIKEVIVDKKWDDQNQDIWIEQANKTRQLFLEAKITLRFWDGILIPIVKFNRGQIIS